MARLYNGKRQFKIQVLMDLSILLHYSFSSTFFARDIISFCPLSEALHS